jgi:hypothetical protein
VSSVREKIVERVLKEFDFKRVHKAMCAVEWEWAGSDGTPSIAEMRATARNLLHDVLENGKGFAATGGFRAYIADDELCLVFELEDAFTEISP